VPRRDLCVDIEPCGNIPFRGYSKTDCEVSRIYVSGGKQLLLEFWEAGVSLGKSCKTR